MTVQTVVEKLQSLSQQDLELVSRFVDGLKPSRKPQNRKDLIGVFADLGITVSAEAFEEARREMWRGFPRELAKDEPE